MLQRRSIEHFLKIPRSSFNEGRLAIAITTLILIPDVGVSYQILPTIGVSTLTTITLVIAIVPCHILLLALSTAVFLALVRLIIIRTRVLCIIRVRIFGESTHEVTHVLALALEPPSFCLRGGK